MGLARALKERLTRNIEIADWLETWYRVVTKHSRRTDMRLVKRMIFFTLACVTVCGAVALGQVTSGTVSGTMLDPQGNVLAGATVKVKNLGTGATREVTSSSNGTYRVTGLAPGRYEVEAAAQGFAPEKRSELSLTVAEE